MVRSAQNDVSVGGGRKLAQAAWRVNTDQVRFYILVIKTGT